MASAGVRGVSRVLVKLQNSVENGNYYEAHQMYRTLYFRYLGQKKYAELQELMFDGSKLFLSCGQNNSGVDLAILLVDVLVKAKCSDVDAWVPKLAHLFKNISCDIPERDVFLANALRWSMAEGQGGHPLLHQSIAQIYWTEKNYQMARHHFLHSRDGHGCARLLIELQTTKGFSCEVDLFIAQAVLQYLCLSNQNAASETFTDYTQQHPVIKNQGPPYLFPLLNFIWLLLQAVETRKLAAFTVLCEQYQPSIKRDPCYVEYLDKIGQIFFGVKPPQQRQAGGLIGNWLQNILESLDDEEEEDDDNHPFQSSRASTSRQTVKHSELD